MDPLSAPAPATAQRDVPALPAQQLTSTSKKRNHQGEIVNHVNSVVTPPVDQQSSPLTANQSRSGSPALSDASTPLTDLGATPTLSPAQVTMPPASSKKAKLSFAEREAEKALKKQEKEEKERQKAEVKAKKEEERVKKEEEKEIARKAKEDKKKQRDAEKQEREAERERKAAEVIKKERVCFITSPSILASAVNACRLNCELVLSLVDRHPLQRHQPPLTMFPWALLAEEPLLSPLISNHLWLRPRS